MTPAAPLTILHANDNPPGTNPSPPAHPSVAPPTPCARLAAMDRDSAVVALDMTLDWLAHLLVDSAFQPMLSGEAIRPGELPHRLLDFPVDTSAHGINDIYDGLAETPGFDEEVAEVRHVADVAMAAAFEDLHQALWEAVGDDMHSDQRQRSPRS